MSAPQTPPPTPKPSVSVPKVPPLPTVATPAMGPAPIPTTAPLNNAAPTPQAASDTPVSINQPNVATPQAAATPPLTTATPNATSTPSAPPQTSANPQAPNSAAPENTVQNPAPTAPPKVALDKATEDAQAAEVKKAKSAYTRARILKIFGRLRRHVAFFILCALFLYTNIWMFARAWQQEKAGENENWFHEGLFLVLLVLALVMFYYRLYQKSEVYQAALAKKEAAEKAAREARLKLEEEQKKQAFMGLIKDFQSASTYDQKSSTMAKLLTVGIESNLLRQQAIDLLCDLNEWMVAHKTFLSSQNLIVWRLKSSLFEQSERFQVDSATQDLTIKAVNIIEAIVKKHITEFMSGRTKYELDLSHKTIPTLTLTAQDIPGGSIKFEGSNLWQASFAETKLINLSFAECDLQGASFWRAKFENIDFREANLQFSKLRTNLQSVQNLSAKQFFATKEWELCYLSQEQQAQFFADTENMPQGAKSNWDSSEPRRRKLYFHLLREANTLKNV